ncbi:MAG: UDP-N-acetylmuramoyl-tripeptide--D-alanyl-D-alanine ligase [Deltaproteobacteria bacterium]|nr:UDP-N-acetylmuramoyl-tripeptide--D-alanyl-D-alanine ligase [Deltaproteobacteria bacterium]
MRLTVADIIDATGGDLLRGNAKDVLSGISIDSRSISKGELFVALSGENFNGHDFIGAAVDGGAKAILVERGSYKEDADVNLLAVDDTLKALGDLASFIRAKITVPVIAVSGSSGKTTTKEMIGRILEASRRVLKTEGNKNNLIGLPLTLFRAYGKEEAIILELGISIIGEMERLTEIAAPTVAVITNIGRSHMEGLGGQEKIAREKFKLFNAESIVTKVVNIDDEWSGRLGVTDATGKVITFGKDKAADVVIKEWSSKDEGICVEYEVEGESVTVGFASPLVANIYNGAAAIGAALAVGVSPKAAASALDGFTHVGARMKVTVMDGVTIMDDTYNANPDSMEAALITLMEGRNKISSRAKTIAVLGEMLELGTESKVMHRALGKLCGNLGVDIVFAVGNEADVLREGAISVRTGSPDVVVCKDNSAAIEGLKHLDLSDTTVLVKGSRGAKTEEVVEGLKEYLISKGVN